MSQIKVFIINLKRSNDRRKYIQKLFKPLNIQYEIFPATDGRDLKEQEYQTIRERGRNIVKKHPWRTLMSRNEIGCALSHLRVYQKIVKEKIDYACILEDDIALKNADDFKYCLIKENLLDLQKKQKWDFIYLYATHTRDANSDYYYWDRRLGSPDNLGMQWGGTKIKENLHLKKLETINFWGAVAYIINQKAAQTFLADGWPVKKLSDVLTGSAKYLGLKQYTIIPMPLNHKGSLTTTIHNDYNVWVKIKKNENFPTLRSKIKKSFLFFLLRKMGLLNLKIIIKKLIYYD